MGNNMRNINLEKVESQEQIDSLCEIVRVVWHETYDPLLPDGQVEYMLDKFQSDHAVKAQMKAQGYRYYLIKIEGKPAGFVGFSPRYENREEMFLSKIYLLPEYHGTGAVSQAFALVEKETREEGLSKIRLTVNKGNEHAIGVYSHYGFQVEEQVKSDIGSGYVMDDYVMVKEL